MKVARSVLFLWFFCSTLLFFSSVAAQTSVGNPGWDRFGSDLPNMPVQSPSVQDCATKCQQNSACVAWSFGTCTPSNVCWLKGASGSLAINSCRTSGTKVNTILPFTYEPLPVGVIAAGGWLQQQLNIQAQGLAGHLQDFWPSISNSLWIGGNTTDPGEQERVPYWLNGVVPLVHLTGDQHLTPAVVQYINYILQHQTSSGWMGPNDDNDPWPRYPLLLAFIQHYEAQPDQNLLNSMTRLMDFIFRLMPQTPLSSWAQYRWQDLVLAIHWMYDREIGPSPQYWYDFAELVHTQGFDWAAWYASTQFPHSACGQGGTCQPDMSNHGVNVGQGMKSSAVWYRQSGSQSDLQSSIDRVAQLDEYHGLATGILSCSENLAGLNTSQGAELCTIVETMYSFEVMVSVFGNASWADRVERLAFNALPGGIDAEMWSHVYISQVNNIASQHCDPYIYVTDGPDSNIYGLEPNFGCCTANFPQGWPKYVTNMYATFEDSNSSLPGLASLYYGPSQVKTLLGDHDSPVVITQSTAYPFEETISYAISATTSFLFRFRVPDWCENASAVLYRDQVATPFNNLPTGWFTVEIPEGPSTLAVSLPMQWRVQKRSSGGISIYRGPLLYALQLDQQWTQLNHYQFNSSDWQIEAGSNWTYALLIDFSNPESSLTFTQGTVNQYPFAPWQPPVSATVQARLINWGTYANAAAQPPQSPVSSSSPLQTLRLVPFGCTQLRIAEFPYLAN